MRIRIALMSLAVATPALVGCAQVDPCADVPKLTPEQREAAISLLELDERFEVEFAVTEDIDCEITDTGTFRQESE